MNKQLIVFTVEKTNNIITSIGKSYISHPKIHFAGGCIKWYEDKLKQQCNKES